MIDHQQLACKTMLATTPSLFASRSQYLGLKQNKSSSASAFSGVWRHIAQEKKMEYIEQKEVASTYQSNSRAEDGEQPCSQWNTLCEGVLIPLGSLFVVFLFMLGVMLITT
jgi:hypothetical protein